MGGKLITTSDGPDLQVRLRMWALEFVPALRTTWPYFTTGLILGAGLLYLEGILPLPPLYSLILEHLGLAFLVSAIAVFFYEWGSHQKKLLEHSIKLAEIHDFLCTLVKSRGERALERGLMALLPGEEATPTKIRSHLDNITRGVSDLLHSTLWAKTGYLECVTELLEAIDNNVHTLTHLANPGDYHYLVGGASTADAILAAQMMHLQPGDCYLVISHLDSWTHHRLDKLHRESQIATVNRHVRVRRVFNLLRGTLAQNEKAARAVLADHVEAAAESDGQYEVRVLRESDISPQEEPDTVQRLQGAQMAFFIHGSSVLRVNIPRVDLSILSMSESAMANDDRRFFDRVWRMAAPLTHDLIDECVSALFPDSPSRRR